MEISLASAVPPSDRLGLLAIRPLQNHPGVKTVPPSPGWIKTSPVVPGGALSGSRSAGHRSGPRALSHSTLPNHPNGVGRDTTRMVVVGFRPSAGFVVSLSLLGRIEHPAFPSGNHVEVETTMGGRVPTDHS